MFNTLFGRLLPIPAALVSATDETRRGNGEKTTTPALLIPSSPFPPSLLGKRMPAAKQPRWPGSAKKLEIEALLCYYFGQNYGQIAAR